MLAEGVSLLAEGVGSAGSMGNWNSGVGRVLGKVSEMMST